VFHRQPTPECKLCITHLFQNPVLSSERLLLAKEFKSVSYHAASLRASSKRWSSPNEIKT